MNTLIVRTLTGIGLVLAIVLLIAAGRSAFLLLIALIDGIGLSEFYNLNKSSSVKPMVAVAVVLSLLVLLAVYYALWGHNYRLFLLALPAIFLLQISELYRKQENPQLNLAITFMGLIYITLPLCLLVALTFLPEYGGYNTHLLLGYFIILWSADTGAYITGKLIGRHPLFKRISPGKTWEGSAGGVTCALLAVLLFSRRFTVLSTYLWVAIALTVVVTGTYGDLFKSMLKRSAHVKDAGHLLPGHGGILDRFDSLLGSAPFVYALLIICR